MSALEASIDNLTAEYTALTQKLEQIDQQYRVERPGVVSQITQLARALSALTGKPVAGPSGNVGRKPMSAEGKAAIKAGLERARAAKQAGSVVAADAAQPKPADPSPAPQPKLVASHVVATASMPAKKDAVSEKPSTTR
jgi:hypothetical protein